MTTTSSPPQGSLVAPMLALLGPVFALVASVVASDGEPRRLVHDAGTLAFVAIAASFVITFVVAALVFTASRGRPGAAALTLPLVLVPWAVMVLAMVWGADLVAQAVAAADPSSRIAMVAMGTAEVMASRILGTSAVFGGALALTLAMLVLALAEPVDGRSKVPGSGYALLVLVVLAGTALAALIDASVLRGGLGAVSTLGFEARVAMLSETLDVAYDSHEALLGGVGLLAFTGVAMLVLALRGGSGVPLVMLSALGGMAFGITDAALSYYVAAVVELEAPWGDEFGFDPLALNLSRGPAGEVTCLATREYVRCAGSGAGYDGLEAELPRAPSDGALPPGISLVAEPALSVAIDAGLSARELRLLLEGAARAGYRSLTVVGGVMLPPFRALEDSADAEIPPLLESQAMVTPITSWLLVAAAPQSADDLAPVVVEVRDDDTAASVAARTSAVQDQSVLVVPGALPSIAPSAVPPPVLAPADVEAVDAVGILGSNSPPAATSGALDPAEISRVIRTRSNVVRACFERGVRDDPNLGGRVMMRITIQPSGAVSDVVSSSTLSASVLRCMEDAVRGTTFPADEHREPVTVSYPFIFGTSP